MFSLRLESLGYLETNEIGHNTIFRVVGLSRGDSCLIIYADQLAEVLTSGWGISWYRATERVRFEGDSKIYDSPDAALEIVDRALRVMSCHHGTNTTRLSTDDDEF